VSPAARLVARVRAEEGLGLVELLIALVVINVAIFALMGAFGASTASVIRAGRIGTGTVLAERQLELYRGMLWTGIGLHATLVASASSNATHVADAAAADAQTTNASCTTTAPECMPIQNVTGPDGKAYRIDTYVSTLSAVTGGRAVKRVTVVVRSTANLATPVARLQATFDRSSGCVYQSSTNPC
jgi:hypothetical protein